ncbi:Glutathione hydrolase proenzyme [Polaromonas vacuolata]|uniref:Glutathione hydrolase proenzyme n=1 Tax=Polaromonas vacuolata TaxID=37448 RepID=A0A6H2H8F5_9BURK|nr:gamma-glutamyltransferase family protein [Polaromonas vacuolata]QJC56073.1 Glutathione hydrolase proenzyme [Polaromonas vacuolata]
MKKMLLCSALALAYTLSAQAQVNTQTQTPNIQPEAASGYSAKTGHNSAKFSVAAANPLATQAGYDILKKGGSAVDAAIAVQMVLGLVEPQSSGLGGGAFLLHFDGKTVEAFDGRETAPTEADENLLLSKDGQPMPFYTAVVGGLSVGTPGAVRMLELAHQQHGKLPWASLFEPAIELAEQGFEISPRLYSLLADEKYLYANDAQAASYFYLSNGQPRPIGSRLRNPALADILRQIAEGGSKALLEGVIAQSIVAKVQGHATNPGKLSLADLSNYRAKQRDPLCSDYSASGKSYVVCGMPPPSSGALTVAQILGLLSYTNAANLQLSSGKDGLTSGNAPAPSSDWLHLYNQAARLAFADRNQYIADPDFVAPPAGSWTSLLAPNYLNQRAKLIAQSPGSAPLKNAIAGQPQGANLVYAPMAEQSEYGTSHISVIDAAGNALAMTTTIESQFGARLMVDGGTGKAGGFLLNNELTDFSFAPRDANGTPVANRVEAGKRPRSSMAPTLVFDKDSGKLLVSAGSPGGALIIHFVAKTLYGSLNWGLDVQQAINLPNFGSTGGALMLEENRFSPAAIEALRDRGTVVNEINMTSGLQAIQTLSQGFFGAADPRREGLVLGD